MFANKLSYYALLLMLCSFTLTIKGQECEWLELGVGSRNEFSFAVTVDKNNDAIICGSFFDTFSITNFGKTYNFTKNTPPSSFNAETNAHLIKYDKDGKIIWVQQTSRGTPRSSSFFRELKTDTKGDIYVSAELRGTINFGNGVSISSADSIRTDLAIVKYNANGVAQWARVFNPASGNTNFATIGFVATDASDNAIIGFAYRGSVNIGGTSQSLNSGSSTQNDIAIVKYTSQGNYVGSLAIGGAANESVISVECDASNNVFLLFNSPATLTVGSTTFADTGICLLKLSPSLNLIKGKKFTSSPPYFFSCYGIAVTENGESVFSGIFRDSINLGGFGLASTVSGARNINATNTVVVFLDSALNTKWVKKGEGTIASSAASPVGGTAIRNGFIYFGGQFQGSDIIWDNTLTMKFIPSSPNLFIVKMDTLGNFLWAFGGGANGNFTSIRGVEADLDGNGIITGTFASFVNVINKSGTGNTTPNFFTAKIVDYTITRGNVSPGPYCAGDSFDIPYTKTGTYDTGNFFIAQLSDSAGNFDGGERELGRIRDTAAGFIRGVLPLFDVATTEKYRIRIISTKPVVQSFFRRDTLRLLIYSKDTANAGPDITICKGQSVSLGTTGGSKWIWSPPTYFVNAADTSNRRPLVKPDSTIEYRIIISDSSGCGVTDTDYVKIIVRPEPNVTIQGVSQTCRGQLVNLQAIATGGDSSYWYEWTKQDSGTILSSNQNINVSPAKTTTYRLVAGDSCSAKIDTAYFTLKIDTVLTVFTSQDTIVCKGGTANLSAWGSGCDSSKYRFSWTDSTDTATILSTQAVFSPKMNANTTYKVVLQDTSTSLSDTGYIKVTIDDVFNATLTPDSTICLGQSITLVAGVIACDTSQLTYTWSTGDTGKIVTLNPTKTETFKVIVSNSFNGLSDSAFVTVTVRDSIKVSVNPDTLICVGQQAQLRAVITGGRNNTYQLQWQADAGGWTGNQLAETVSPIVNTRYKAVVTDGCTTPNDSAFITVFLRDSLKVSTPYTDTTVCYGELFSMKASATGGDSTKYSFTWKLPDNSTTTQPSIIVNGLQNTSVFTVYVTDNCTGYTDSQKVTINVRPALNAGYIGKNQLCYRETSSLQANVTGGNSNRYAYTWVFPNGSIDTSANITIQPDSSFNIILIADDNCSNPQKDSIIIPVSVPSPIKVSVEKDTVLCLGWNLPLTASITGGIPANYKINWQGTGTTSADTTTSLTISTINTPGNYIYIASVTDNCSRTGADTVSVDILPSPVASFSINDTTGCPPLNLFTTDLSQNRDSTLNSWQLKGNGVNINDKSPIPSFILPQSGVYTLSLRVENTLGCADSLTLTGIEVFEKPSASFYTVSNLGVNVIDEPITFMNSSTKATLYKWFLGENDSIEKNQNVPIEKIYTDTGTYLITLVAVNNFGCKDTARQPLTVINPFTFFIPNAFTPTSSLGLNDVFAPVTTGTQTYSMIIFNRWGEVIYNCDCENGCPQPCAWDGNYKAAPATEGMYSYIIRFRAIDKRIRTVFGSFTLIR